MSGFPGPVQYWRTEAGQRFGTVFGHRSQPKSFNHGIRPRAALLVPRYHCFTLSVENGKVVFFLLCYLFSVTPVYNDVFRAMEVHLGSTVLIHCCKKTVGITISLCAQCYVQAAPWKSSLLWPTLPRPALWTWQLCPDAGIAHPFRIVSMALASARHLSGIFKTLKSELWKQRKWGRLEKWKRSEEIFFL